MPRPRKFRRVCDFPQTLAFYPEYDKNREQAVVLTVDEYETIRLIDKEGLSQEQCGAFMQVARSTVQQIYASARKKLATMLVDGLSLRIEGGDYQLCNEGRCSVDSGDCYRQRLDQQYEKSKDEPITRIAVTYENGEIFQNFGYSQQFKVYDVENGKLLSSAVVNSRGRGNGAMAGMLSALRADVLICGGIDCGAQMALAQAGIKLYGGISGSADAAVKVLLAGELVFGSDGRCNHHDHVHGGETQACGDHVCGQHSCG